ncbi:MAG: hypothetical protein ACK5VH_05820 [bacterium]
MLYRHEGSVTECPRANFFIIDQEGRSITPMRNMLHGVTRRLWGAMMAHETEWISSRSHG